MLEAHEKRTLDREADKTKYLQAQLASGSLRSRLWAFMNSSFVLWFLSAIVVTLITDYTAKSTAQRELDRKHAERQYRLMHEVGARWYKLYTLTSMQAERQLATLRYDAKPIERVLFHAEKRDCLYVEFEGLSLYSLLYEIEVDADLADTSRYMIRQIRRELMKLEETFHGVRADVEESDTDYDHESWLFLGEQIGEFRMNLSELLEHWGYVDHYFQNDPAAYRPPFSQDKPR